MSSLAPFLPNHLARSLAASGPPAKLPHVERFPAALLLSDISGFTALTERLQSRGREGAEEITDVVRSSFRPAIETIDALGGSIVSFGGDAVFAAFPGEDGVARARRAAEEVRASFTAGDVVTTDGPVRLGISQAIHAGSVAAMHLGVPERRLHLVGGAAVTALARLGARATAGAILMSPAARSLAGMVAERRRPPDAEAADALLIPYVPPHVRRIAGDFDGEFRRVAVLFLETRGGRLAALQRFVELLWRVLDAHDGILVGTDLSPYGTKWICAFGAPVAHEDDPDRASASALAMLRGLPPGLAMRGGFHAGVVASIWMGTATRRSYDLMGDVTNTAARALARAAWGEVVTTETTRVLLRAAETSPRGLHAVKGKAEPLALHALAATRRAVRVESAAAPMVGRDAELAQARRLLERARQGDGGTLAIEGTPGIGKSRLKWETAKLARAMGMAVHEGRAAPFGGAPYGAVAELLRHALDVPDGSGAELALARIASAVARLGLDPVDGHHLADILGERGEGSSLVQLRPQDIRLGNTVALNRFLRASGRVDGGQLLVLEDMQWADELTRGAAEWMTRAVGGGDHVLLLLHRPGYEPPGRSERIVLRELGEEAVVELLGALLPESTARVAALVQERAGGNPFYVEELARHLRESGILARSDRGYQLLREPRPEELPTSVESVISTRLDRLPAAARRVAQVAAVIGRSFRLRLLEQLPDVGPSAAAAVAELEARELVFERVREPHLEYIWKHAITRDVAYGGILAARRRGWHRAVADALEELYPDERGAHLAALGHHREHAGQRAEARDCYLSGARASARRFAHEESERLYRRFLSLVDEESEESLRARRELGIELLHLGRSREADAEWEATLSQARARGHRHLEATTLAALASHRLALGRLDESRDRCEASLRIMRELGDRLGEGVALGNLGILEMRGGRTGEARALFERSAAMYQEAGDLQGVGSATTNLAGIDFELGRFEEAGELCQKVLQLHREMGNLAAQVMVLGNLGSIRLEQGRLEESLSHYEAALAAGRAVGHRGMVGATLCSIGAVQNMRSWHEADGASLEEGIALLRESRT